MPDVNITPSENGPYIVSGPVTLTDVDGRVIEHPDPDVDVPMRRILEQAVLRRHTRHDRLRRHPGELIAQGAPLVMRSVRCSPTGHQWTRGRRMRACGKRTWP